MRRGLSLARGRALALSLIVATGACGRSPQPADLAQSAQSWGATAHLVVDRWEHGAVTRKFATLTLDRASSEMSSVAQQAAQLPDTSRDRARIMLVVATVRQAVAVADTAAQRDDRAAATEAMRWLEPRYQAEALARAGVGQASAPRADARPR